MLSDKDREELKTPDCLLQEAAQLLLDGDLYRLRSPFTSNECAWMVVSPARDEALVTHVTVLSQPNPPQCFLKLKGLDAAAHYTIGDLVRRGDALLNIGLPIPYPLGDFVEQCLWHISRIA